MTNYEKRLRRERTLEVLKYIGIVLAILVVGALLVWGIVALCGVCGSGDFDVVKWNTSPANPASPTSPMNPMNHWRY